MKLFKVFALSLFFSGISLAQISVTSNSLLSWLGFTQTIQADTSGAVSVNVGSPGENQYWDFTGLTTNGPAAVYEFFSAGDTPYASSFPDANFVYKVTLDIDGAKGTLFRYLKLSNDGFVDVGGVMVYNGSIIAENRDNEVTPLPLSYGSSWESVSADTFEIPGVSMSITTTTETHTIDGWGKIKLPSGEFNCLRWKTEGEEAQVTIVGGVTIPTFSYTYIEYTWLGENSLLLANVTSRDNETNPDFNIADDVSWLSEVTSSTSVFTDTPRIPESFQLTGNFPNPFNPSTTISFSLPRDGRVTVEIFDMNGRQVRRLMQDFNAGEHSMTWHGRADDGRPLGSGTYLYAVNYRGDRHYGKMTLLR